MMPARHIARRSLATSLACGIALLLVSSLSLRTIASPAATSQDVASALVLEQVEAAFARARGWLDEFNPPRMQDETAAVEIDRATAACVILRRHGRVMGVGVDDAGDALMLRRAVGRAMNEALSDPALVSLASAIRRDARTEQGDAASRDAQAEARLDSLRRDLGRSLTLELEIAGPRLPLVGRSLDALALKIDPGADGLAIRRQQIWTLAFPSQLRITNQGSDSSRALSNLAVAAGISLAELGELGALQDTGFYAFNSVNLAQDAPDAGPIQLMRGEVLVRIEDVTRARVQSLADGLAQHILRCAWPAPPEGQPRMPLGFMGDYEPWSDQFMPPIASPLEQALFALALVRYAQAPSTDTTRAKDAAVAARQALRDLAEVAQGELPASDDPAACAAMLLAVCEMPSCLADSSIDTMLRAAHARLAESFDAQQGFIAPQVAEGQPSARPLSSTARAMIAYAWARLLGAKLDRLPAPEIETIRAAIDAAWQATEEPQRIAMLPWIGWAERDFAKASGQDLAHAAELQRLASALDRSRITAATPEASPDLLGGLLLTGESSERPMPTVQTVRPAAWLMSIARDPQLTRAEHAEACWNGNLETLRFLCQLSMSDTRASLMRNASRAAGGVCAGPADCRQVAAAQSLALLAALEALANWPTP